MFTLEDGREQLYQWDLDRRIIVNDSKICEVHFCNRTSDCSLVVEVIDGYANIPNILLQDARPIRAYAYCDDSYTLTEQQFTVKARTKPADYVYTETETLQYSTLDERIKAIETGITDTVATEVNKYMEDNPITVDLSNYYNKAETVALVGTAIEGIEIPETDLTGYATEQFVLDKVAEIDIPEASPYVYTIKIENDDCVNPNSELRTLYDKVLSGESVLCYWSCPEGICHTRICINTNTSIVMVIPSHAYVQGKEVKFISGQLNLQSNGTSVYVKTTNSKTAPTIQKVEEMITSALSGIATAEGGSY